MEPTRSLLRAWVLLDLFSGLIKRLQAANFVLNEFIAQADRMGPTAGGSA